MKTLVQRLIAAERDAENDPDKQNISAFRVCEKLCGPLGTLAGRGGVRALLTRAVVLARAKAPLLNGAQVKPDGALQFSTELQAQLSSGEAARAGAILAAELLELLAIFIGEALTLRLVQEVWPKAANSDQESNREKT